MAKPRKVGKRWKMEIRRKGVHKYATFDTKSEAIAWGKDMERIILGGAIEQSKDTTFYQIAHKYLREVATHKKGWRWEDIRIKKLLNDGLGSKILFKMDRKYWKRWISARLSEVAPSSVNRELNLISAIFEHAIELEWIEHNPVRGIKRPKNPKHRDRRISDEEIKSITDCLGMNPETSMGQTAIAFLLAIETGMRRSELLNLTESDIDLDNRFVTLRDSKNGDSRDVALSKKAVELLELVSVFTISPGTLTTLFKRACGRCNIHDLTFHDTRHEAVSRLARKLDLLDLARMIGHRDPKSLMVYYNATASEIAKRLD